MATVKRFILTKWLLRVIPVILLSVITPVIVASEANATDAVCFVQSIAPKLSSNERWAIAAARQRCWGALMGRNQVRVLLQERVEDRMWPLPDKWETRSISQWVVSYGPTYPFYDNINTAAPCKNDKRRLHRSIAQGSFWTTTGDYEHKSIIGPGVWLYCNT